MKAQGYQLSEGQIQGICHWIKKASPFTAADLTAVAELNGIPAAKADRAADRILQKLKKLRAVALGPNRRWSWRDSSPVSYLQLL